MRTKIFLFILILVALQVNAQKAVDASGNVKSRGNVAIFVTSNSFHFGSNTQSREDQQTREAGVLIAETLVPAVNAVVMQKFQHNAYSIVNRDNEAFRKVQSLLEENKLEDYLDGISVQAKGQGANYLYIVNLTLYTEEDKIGQLFVSTRLLNVENNLGYHYSYKTNPIYFDSNMKEECEKMVNNILNSLEQQLYEEISEQFWVESAKGKDLTLGLFEASSISEKDLFYAFKVCKEPLNINDKIQEVNVLDFVSEGKSPKIKDGKIHIKTDKNIEKESGVILFRNVKEPIFRKKSKYVTFFGLNYDNNTYDGLIRSQINDAVYAAINRNPGLVLVEHDHLPELKKERELQKSEDFLDGHVVAQMKAIGAGDLIHLENFSRNGACVSFKMSFISVSENRIWNTVDVVSNIDNLENELYKQICENFKFPCNVAPYENNKFAIKTAFSLPSGTKCVLKCVKPQINPLTNEQSYIETDVCKCLVSEYHGYKAIMNTKKVLSKTDFKELEKNSSDGNYYISIDTEDIKSDTSKESNLRKKLKKEKRKEKAKKILGGIARGVGGFLNNVEIK